MRYETPEVTCLKPAIDAVQGVISKAGNPGDNMDHESSPAYEDWE